MSDSYRCFRAILSSLKSLYKCENKGNFFRRLRTASFLINGIIRSKSCHLSDAASHCADFRKPASREKSFSRLIKNKNFSFEVYYMPFAQALINAVQIDTIAVSFDASVIGRGCIALVAGLVYKKRSLPLCWIVKEGSKGHFAEEMHIELLQQLMQIVPDTKKVVILGDGEFDGSDFLFKIKKNNWFFVVRTAENRILNENGEPFYLRDLGVGKEQWFYTPNVTPQNHPDLSYTAVVWWRTDCKEPVYLLTNIQPICEALFWYKKRFSIETFFSDQKTRGFNIHKSHVSDPMRMSRLLIAASLAYIFIVYLGLVAIKNGVVKHFHRTNRCDWSLFKIGCNFLNYQLSRFMELPKMVQLDLFSLIE